MKLAMSNPEGPVFGFPQSLREQGIKESRTSPRKRILLPIHRDQADLVQRMVNFLQPGTYIQPHQHPREFATETILVMGGEMGFLTFGESGELLTSHRLGVGDLIDIEARVWHGVVALKPDTIILEVKRGPYDDSDKVFAEWAPAENTAEAAEYQNRLESVFS